MQNFSMLNTKELARRILEKSQQGDRLPAAGEMKIIFSPAEYLHYVSARRLGAAMLRIPLFTFLDNEEKPVPQHKKSDRHLNPSKLKKNMKGGKDHGSEIEI
jgi:hypothetical protein